MKKVLFPILALVLALGLALPMAIVGADPANLLTNPGAEGTPNMTGWTHTANVYATALQVQGSCTVYPQAGSHFFSFHGAPATSGNMSQNVGLSIDNSAGEFGLYRARCWYQTNMIDAGEMVVEFWDDAASLGSVTTGALNNSGGKGLLVSTWAQATLGWGFVPCDADSADFTLKGTTHHTTMCNVYYDTLEFDVAVGTLSLAAGEPEEAFNPVGTQHTVDVDVGVSGEDVEVRFEVTGDNTASGEVTTDTGTASFSYTGTNPGKDTITAYIDLNGNDTLDTCEPSVTQTKYWLEHFVTGGGMILEGTRKTAAKITFGGNVGFDLDGNEVGQWNINFHNVNNNDLDKGHFHTTEITEIDFGDVSACPPPNPPVADYNYAHFVATGRFNGEDGWEDGWEVRFNMTDYGEGNKIDPDGVRIRLWDPDDPWTSPKYDSSAGGKYYTGDFPKEGYCTIANRTNLDGGNIQIHPPEIRTP